ncbi:MAG TPA: hypothetical protein VGN16_25225 [Acidobacteriaceae bacterium]|jgi:hypothetical protein
MAINIANAPEQSMQVLTSTVQNWMAHPITAPQAANAGISFVADSGIDVHLPHPAYNLGAADIVSGKGLAAAVLVSWRYLLSDGETTAMAEIAQQPAGHAASATPAAPVFSMLNRGPFVSSLVDAVNSAQSNTHLTTGNYEVASLNIPALYIVALWLKSPNPGGGAVVPLAPAPSYLNAGQTYTEAAFLAAITPAAQAAVEGGGAAKV